jgi:hypothetical protein
LLGSIPPDVPHEDIDYDVIFNQCAQECIERVVLDHMVKFLRFLHVVWNDDEDEDDVEEIN